MGERSILAYFPIKLLLIFHYSCSLQAFSGLKYQDSPQNELLFVRHIDANCTVEIRSDYYSSISLALDQLRKEANYNTGL